MKISQKLLIGFFGSSLLVGGYSFFTLGIGTNIKSETQKIIEATSVEIEIAKNLSESLESIHEYTEQLLIIDNSDNYQAKVVEHESLVNEQFNNIIANITKGKRATLDETNIVFAHNKNKKVLEKLAQDQTEDLESLEQLNAELSSYQNSVGLFFNELEANKLEVARDFYTDELKKRRQKLNKLIADYQQSSVEEVKSSQEYINSQIEDSLNQMPFYGLLALTFSLAIYFYLYRTIYSPLKQVKLSTIQKIEKDLKVQVDKNLLKGDDFDFLTQTYEIFQSSFNHKQRSAKYLKTILGAIKHSLIILTPELTIQQTNQSTVQLFGYSQEELEGQHINFLIKDLDNKQIDKGQVSNISNTNQKIGVTKSKKEFFISMETTLLFNDEHEISTIVCFIRDITDEYKQLKSLRDNEQRYKLATLANNHGIWDLNACNNQIYYSLHWKSLLGYQDSEINSTLDDWFKIIHPDYLEKFKAELNNALKSHNSPFHLTYLARHKNGTYRWMDCYATSLKDNFGRIERLVGSQTDITEQKQIQDSLQSQLKHDNLTNLYNRNALNYKFEELSQKSLQLARQQNNKQIALVFIDIDSFRGINESLGYAAGDKILIELSNRLTNYFSALESFIARLGGDRFVIILESISNQRELKILIENLIHQIEKPFKIDLRHIFINISLGIALSSNNSDNLTELLRDSETAMHWSKKSSQTNYSIFAPPMYLSQVARLDLENSLYQAINNSELKINYQPIFQLFDRKITGFEAIVGWATQKSDFVSLYSQLDNINNPKLLAQTNWLLLEKACSQLSQWQEKYGKDSPLSIYIKILDSVLFQDKFPGRIARILEDNHLQPNHLILGFSPSSLEQNPQLSLSVFKDLKALGIYLALDDNKNSYLPLNDLEHFPIDLLRLNCSSLHNIDNNPAKKHFIQSLISLAHSLKIKTVASFVETSAHSQQVSQLKYHYGQGSFYSGLQTADVAEALIINQQSSFPKLKSN